MCGSFSDINPCYLMEWSENVGHKLYMDTFLSSPLFDNLHAKIINCCGGDTQDKEKFQIILDRKLN